MTGVQTCALPILEALGITVYIKTDNDIFKKSNGKYFYAGITRSLKYLNKDSKEKLQQLLNFDLSDLNNFECDEGKTEIYEIEEHMKEICEIFKSSRIIFSNHHKGFEKDFLDYINYTKEDYDEIIDNLKSAKLINLHEFINNNEVDISIDKNDKNSILLGFIIND